MITADIGKAIETNGRSIIADIEQTVTLAIIDEHWKEHLRGMDELKAATSLASFEQKDPLVVYKMEAYNLFEGLIRQINEATTAYLAKGDLVVQSSRDVQEARAPRQPVTANTQTNRSEEEQAQRRAAEGATPRQKVETFKRDHAKVKRNDLCPCGSGKKFKHCHGK